MCESDRQRGPQVALESRQPLRKCAERESGHGTETVFVIDLYAIVLS
jgi:hypothetical protein